MIALLGRLDSPTDGVDDYCMFLGQALALRELTLTRVHVLWNEEGWKRALRRLWRDSADWQGKWVLVQYTALNWSRRGFPFGVLAAVAVLRRRGARCAVVFHEHTGFGGLRWRERLRHEFQMWVMRRLYRSSVRSIFTVPLDTIDWLPPVRAERVASKDQNKRVFIPIGANIPECLDGQDGRSQPRSLDHERRVLVYGVTGAPAAAGEVADIVRVALEARKSIPALRLVIVGRGSTEVREDFANALEGRSVGLDVRGVLSADEIANEFRRADVLLFVRGAITMQRGSALAGIACGLPIVGYGSGEQSGPLAEAGIEWIPLHDQTALAQAVVRVLTDAQLWTDLRERNVRAHKRYFSWNRIAELYIEALAE